MCHMCLHTPCLWGCPNEDDPYVVLYCDFCHKAIIDCEIYTELPSQEVLCEECKVNMNKDELLQSCGAGAACGPGAGCGGKLCWKTKPEFVPRKGRLL